MRIFYWAADTQGCGYYRCMLPAAELGRHGHDVMVDERMPDCVTAGDVDVVVAQRTSNVGASARWQKLCARGDVHCVFEIDDLLWNADRANRPAHRYYDVDRVRLLRDNITAAHLVTTTTEPLAEELRELNSNVVVLPNMVPAWLLNHERPARERTVIGWAGGESHSADVNRVVNPLKRVLRESDAEFHCVGADYTPRLSRRRVRHTGWSESTEAYYRTVDFDVGIAPLQRTPFNECKSDIKVLEYAALGIPAVASRTGPYAAYVGCTASHDREWLEHLTELVNDRETRTQAGKQAREWAATRTIEANWQRWETTYS